MTEPLPIVRVICGPTGAGKTRLATHCAEFADLTIISADSRQLYRGFDIGTAKPSASDRLAAPYRGIDVLDPTERASAAWWATRAEQWIADASDAGRTPLVVGGTGLYLRALFDGLFDEPPLDVTHRAALAAELAPLSVDALRRWVEVLDPTRAQLGRTQLLRAIEMALLTGRRLSDLHRERRTAPRVRARYLVVDPGGALAAQLRHRTMAMFAMGWGDEVERLIRAIPDDAPAWNASGYRTLHDMVSGLITCEVAVDRVVTETRQYAKRQRTWFRHQLEPEHVTLLDPGAGDVGDRLHAWWVGGDA